MAAKPPPYVKSPFSIDTKTMMPVILKAIPNFKNVGSVINKNVQSAVNNGTVKLSIPPTENSSVIVAKQAMKNAYVIVISVIANASNSAAAMMNDMINTVKLPSAVLCGIGNLCRPIYSLTKPPIPSP